ncbi:MAG: ABC transporter ATP-binding protein [Burkholderiaceae bacterium]
MKGPASGGPAAPLLQVQGLRIEVAGRRLVHDLSFAAQAGERWAVLGANGAGKSTLLLTLAGLRAAPGAAIHVQGQPLDMLAPVPLARLRAFAEQQPQDAFSQTVGERVAQARSPFEGRWRVGPRPVDPPVREALRDMDLDALAARDLLQLSGGERQRVTVAAALAQQTSLLLLDEPTAHLDPAHQALVFAALRRRETGAALLALHDVNLALRHCTHVVMLMPGASVAGPIAAVVTPQSLQQTYACSARMVDVPANRSEGGRRLVLWD